jgi:hypothetical protein
MTFTGLLFAAVPGRARAGLLAFPRNRLLGWALTTAAAVFVLVTGTPTRLTVHGWIRGAEAQRDEWRQTHGNRPAAWFVPQDALRPLKQAQAA